MITAPSATIIIAMMLIKTPSVAITKAMTCISSLCQVQCRAVISHISAYAGVCGLNISANTWGGRDPETPSATITTVMATDQIIMTMSVQSPHHSSPILLLITSSSSAPRPPHLAVRAGVLVVRAVEGRGRAPHIPHHVAARL
jgi:hypothetical protein